MYTELQTMNTVFALMRPDRSKQCLLYAVPYTNLRISICVTNYDLSADIHFAFWVACTDTVLALFPDFSGANRLGREVFLQVLVAGIVTNHKQKSSSSVYIALSKCRQHQLH